MATSVQQPKIRRLLMDIAAYKNAIVTVLTPILALPLLFQERSEATCAYCVVIMAMYWMCEVLPLAITALMPVFLFPIMGIVDAKTISKEFLPDTNFLFIGGLIMAVAVEKCNLHERIALKVLTIVGSEPKWIMLGFMCVTAFLSMWISNTATTAMMVPIAESVIRQLIRSYQSQTAENDGELSVELVNSNEPLHMSHLSLKEASIAKGLLISICFAANIGGTATITGTPPNLVMVGLLEKYSQNANTGVNYLSWILFALPLMLISLAICWLFLFVYFLRNSQQSDQKISAMIANKYQQLPCISYAEKSVLSCFILLLILWMTRDPKFIPGFGSFFAKNHFTDATSAMLIAVLLFALPNEKPDFFCTKNRDVSLPPRLRGSLMDWPTMKEKFPWSVVLLLGGGFALAAGVRSSGLSDLIGQLLSGLDELPNWAIQMVCILITMFVTNICSNTVTASIFVPIVGILAHGLGTNPLLFMLPTTLACSFAFVLPVATPPNAIVFASGMLRVSDMMVVGVVMSVLSTLSIVLYMISYAQLVYPLDIFPDWALNFNQTATF